MTIAAVQPTVVLDDRDSSTVSKISGESERVMSKTVQPDLIYAEVNMFMPDGAMTLIFLTT